MLRTNPNQNQIDMGTRTEGNRGTNAEGCKFMNGIYFRVGHDGQVIEARNIFGADITRYVDAGAFFGCKTKGGR